MNTCRTLTSPHYKILESTTPNPETLMLLGGLSRDHTIWRKVVGKLQKHYRLILPDNRDAGQSSKVGLADYSIKELAEDMIALIQHLELDALHLAGHSMGGFMALYIAEALPDKVKSLILCSTAEKQVPAGKAYLEKRIQLMEAGTTDHASTASEQDIRAILPMLYAPANLTPAFSQEIIDFETKNSYPQSAKSFIRQAKACAAHDATNILQNIQAPCLVITGEQDKYYTPAVAANLASKLPNNQVEVIPNAAHMIQIEQPEILISLIDSFIQNI